MIELRNKNAQLAEELDKAREEAVENEPQPKKGKKAGPTVASLQKEVSGLRAQIEKHEKVRAIWIQLPQRRDDK